MGWKCLGDSKPPRRAIHAVMVVVAGLQLNAPGMAHGADSPWQCFSQGDDWVCEGNAMGEPPDHASSSATETVETEAQDPGFSLTLEPGPTGGQDPVVSVARPLDWVPIGELPDELRHLVPRNCCGAYVEPLRDYPDGEREPDRSAVRVSAASTEARGAIATLTGDVQVSQGFRQVRSDSATIDQRARTLQLDGNIIFREPGVLVTGDLARVDLNSGHVDVDNAEFLLHESSVRGTADALRKRSDNRLHIDNATYTTCEPISDAWQLSAGDIDIDTARGMATARNVRLEVADWPILYLPWIRFPISDNRVTGLLYPVIMAGNDNGLDFSQPIYLNLAPNYDATLTPRMVQKRGAMLEAEFRYLNHWSQTIVSGGYLPDDRGGDVRRQMTSSGLRKPYRGEDRWVTYLDHEGGFGQRWNTLVDYTNVSDPDYFRDLGTSTLEANSQSHLNQQIATGYRTDNWHFFLQAQQFETLIRGGLEQYKQMPRLDANGQYHLGNDLLLELRQHAVVFDHSEANVVGTGTPLTRDVRDTTVTGNRLRADYALSWDKQWLWGFFRPTARIKHASYDLDRPLMNQTDDSPSVTVPVVSLDGGLFFEQRDNWLPNHIHTLEPRIYYVRSSFRDQSAIPNFDTSDLTFSYQQLFRDDRFSGGDRIGDTEQFTLGLTTRLINAENGIERLRLSLGQVYYLKDRRVTLNPLLAEELTKDTSDIAAELSANLFDHWRVQADMLYDENDSSINKGSAALRYNDRQGTLFNMVYRYTRRDSLVFQFGPDAPLVDNVRADIEQVDLSLAAPLAPNWRLLARYNHDLRTNQELEIFAGLEYSSCCWRASVVARRWVDRDETFLIARERLAHRTGLFFQIQFRGLAGTGTRVNNILSEGIYGYQPPEF